MVRRPLPSTGYHSHMPNPAAAVTSADATSAASLVAAPGAGKKIVVYGVYFSADTAMSLTLSDTLSFRQWVAASGGQVPIFMPNGDYLAECAANTALTVTAGVAGNIHVKVWFDVLASSHP